MIDNFIVPEEIPGDVDFNAAVETLNEQQEGVNVADVQALSDSVVTLIKDAEFSLIRAASEAQRFYSMRGWELLHHSSAKEWAANENISYDRFADLVRIAENLMVKASLSAETLKGIPMRKLRRIAAKTEEILANNMMEDVLSEARHGSYEDLEERLAEVTRRPNGPHADPAGTVTQKVGQQGTIPTDPVSHREAHDGTNPPQPSSQAPATPRTDGDFDVDRHGKKLMHEGIYVLSRVPVNEAQMVDEKINQGSLDRLNGRIRLYDGEDGGRTIYVKVE